MIDLDISVADARWAALGDVETLARCAIGAAFAVAQGAPEEAEISLVLTDDAAVQILNRDWRGQDRPTNVLSFPAAAPPGAAGPRHLGDIVLAYDTILREAGGAERTLRDHALHLIVHGALHLIGYDHAEEAEAEAMESLEVQALARLGVADPYRDASA